LPNCLKNLTKWKRNELLGEKRGHSLWNSTAVGEEGVAPWTRFSKRVQPAILFAGGKGKRGEKLLFPWRRTQMTPQVGRLRRFRPEKRGEVLCIFLIKKKRDASLVQPHHVVTKEPGKERHIFAIET